MTELYRKMMEIVTYSRARERGSELLKLIQSCRSRWAMTRIFRLVIIRENYEFIIRQCFQVKEEFQEVMVWLREGTRVLVLAALDESEMIRVQHHFPNIDEFYYSKVSRKSLKVRRVNDMKN